MPPRLINFKVGKCSSGNFFSIIYSYLKIAFRAQNYAIINCSSTSKFFGYSGDGIPPSFNVHFFEKRINKFSTFCTHTAHAISSALSPKSTANNSRHEIHNNLSPSFTWCIGRAGQVGKVGNLSSPSFYFFRNPSGNNRIINLTECRADW